MNDYTDYKFINKIKECESKINNSFVRADIMILKAYAILWKGKYVQTRTKKSIWKSLGAAKNAFWNHTSHILYNTIGHSLNKEERKFLLSYWETMGILEFIEITID